MSAKNIYELMEEERVLKEQLEALQKEIKKKQEVDISNNHFRITANNQGRKDAVYCKEFPYQLRFIDNSRKNRYGKVKEYIIGVGDLKKLSKMLKDIEYGAKNLQNAIEYREGME